GRATEQRIQRDGGCAENPGAQAFQPLQAGRDLLQERGQNGPDRFERARRRRLLPQQPVPLDLFAASACPAHLGDDRRDCARQVGQRSLGLYRRDEFGNLGIVALVGGCNDSVELLSQQPSGLHLVQHGELWVYARLERVLLQQAGAEAVNGADVGGLDLPPLVHKAEAVQFGDDTGFHLLCGLLGEGDDEDLSDAGAPFRGQCAASALRDEAHEPLDQHAGLAGTAPCRHADVVVIGVDGPRLIVCPCSCHALPQRKWVSVCVPPEEFAIGQTGSYAILGPPPDPLPKGKGSVQRELFQATNVACFTKRTPAERARGGFCRGWTQL